MKILVFCLLTLLAVSVSGILKFPRPFDGMESGAEDHSQNRDSQAVDEKDIESIDTKWDTEIDYGRCRSLYCWWQSTRRSPYAATLAPAPTKKIIWMNGGIHG
ncbi:hypothetical protein QR680_018639 [Steinernema hermaphroditum]|uniref:Peptidase M14 carboxypeptidase A domain-containing protein n=1 Tax=Steinernema hermaphroditum TaxID=289476 RepID=A0AA39LRE9_9BILA|nr:hypothetical protein QR680_018639 [Steinernema hermaphroditum]